MVAPLDNTNPSRIIGAACAFNSGVAQQVNKYRSIYPCITDVIHEMLAGVSYVRQDARSDSLAFAPSSKRCVVRGVAEKGWCWSAVVVGGRGWDRVVLAGSGTGQRRMWTNVDRVMLEVMVEKRMAGVVWFRDGEYQFEI
jgi:hypothetical protein